MTKIRVFTAFSGYDSQCLALERLKRDYPNFDYELVGCEINEEYFDKMVVRVRNSMAQQKLF